MTSRLIACGLALAGMVCIGGSAPQSAVAQDGSGTQAAPRPPGLPPCFGKHHPAAFCKQCLPVPPDFTPSCDCPDAAHSLVCYLAHLIREERAPLMAGSPKGRNRGPGAGEGEDEGDDEKKDDDKEKKKDEKKKDPPVGAPAGPPPPPPGPPPVGAPPGPPPGAGPGAPPPPPSTGGS